MMTPAIQAIKTLNVEMLAMNIFGLVGEQCFVTILAQHGTYSLSCKLLILHLHYFLS